MNKIKKYIYVVIISEHNLPNLLSVLAQKTIPDKLLLIATRHFTDKAKRFKKVIQLQLPDITVISLPTETLSGELMGEMYQWNKSVLQTYYKQDANEYWILNVTGGTKLMTLALERALKWDEIHYKAFHQAHIQRWTHAQKILEPLSVPDIKTEDALNLYCQFNCVADNPINKYSEAIIIAKQIWAYYDNDRADNPWLALTEQLDNVWSGQSSQHDKEHKLEYIPWDAFTNVQPKAIKDWCRQLHKLSPKAINMTQKGLWIPAQDNKKLGYWKQWISGIWFELLLKHWLIETGKFKAEHIVCNATIKNKRELDFVLFYQNNLYTIEAKVAPAEKEKLNSIVRQITSINNIGRTEKILAISPHFRKSINNNDKEEALFESCKDNDIRIINNQAELNQLFNK